MTPAQAETLKPCPFCGEKTRLEVVSSMQERWSMKVIRCHSCECMGPDGGNAKGAVSTWNNRRPQAPEPSTTLPTEPGLYWWRGDTGKPWRAVDAWRGGGETYFSLISDHLFMLPCLKGKEWESRMGIGQWLPCLPPGSEVKG